MLLSKLTHGLLALSLVILLVGCGPKPEPPPPTGLEELPRPSDLAARLHDRGAELSWLTNRSETTAILGYNIYLSESQLNSVLSEGRLPQGLRPINDGPYPGDTDPNFAVETFALEGLDNGKSYYVAVTTVYPRGLESPPSNVIEVLPRPQGSFTLNASFGEDQSGYSFRRLTSVTTDDVDNDIYLAQIQGGFYVASPGRIDNVFRGTLFYNLGKRGELDQVRIGELKQRGRDRLQVREGEIFLLQDASGCFALARFDSFDRQKQKADISFIYQTRPNTLQF